MAALTLIRHWLDGRADAAPDGSFLRDDEPGLVVPGATMGSFNRWARVVGGVLEAAYVPGFLENRDRTSAVDDATAQLDAFFEAGAAWAQGREFRFKDFADACDASAVNHDNGLADVLPDEVAYARNPRHALSAWFGRNSGGTYAGHTLEGRDGHGGSKNWLFKKR